MNISSVPTANIIAALIRMLPVSTPVTGRLGLDGLADGTTTVATFVGGGVWSGTTMLLLGVGLVE